MKTAALAMLFLSTLVISGQTRTFKWDGEACSFRGTYNPAKYTPAQLRDTLRLTVPYGFGISTEATVFKYEEIAKLSIPKLESEYRAKLAELEGLKIVKSQYWEGQRQMKIRELKRFYTLSRITIQAYNDPEAAFKEQFEGAGQCYTKYAEPIINGGDSLIAAWRQLNEESRAKNGDPDRLRREFDEQNKSPDRMKFALVEVMTFGWWNCANNFVGHVEYDGSQEREFKKLFTRVKTVFCDEP